MRDGPGRARRFGNGQARGKTEGAETLSEIGKEGGLAAEEMRGAGDVEKEAVVAAFGVEEGCGRRCLLYTSRCV